MMDWVLYTFAALGGIVGVILIASHIADRVSNRKQGVE